MTKYIGEFEGYGGAPASPGASAPKAPPPPPPPPPKPSPAPAQKPPPVPQLPGKQSNVSGDEVKGALESAGLPGMPGPGMPDDKPSFLGSIKDKLSSFGSNSDKEETINFYAIAAAACLVGVFVLFGVGLFDIFKVIYDKINQKIKFNEKNPNLLTKDTIEYESLGYISPNINEEPYDIFLQQKIINYVLTIVAIFIFALAMHIGFFLAEKVYVIFRTKKPCPDGSPPVEYKPQISIDSIKPKYVSIIIATGVGLIILSTLYKKYFAKDAQLDVKQVRNDLRSVKSYVYNFLTTDEKFLDAIAYDDINKIVTIIRSTLKKDDTNSCASEDAVCSNDEEAMKMIFTYSLYSYFKYIIPETDKAYYDIMSLFTIDNITNTKLIDPTKYFYYKESIYITNIYDSMKVDLIGSQESPLAFVKKENNIDKFDSYRARKFENNLGNIVLKLNQKLNKMYNLPNSSNAIYKYILIYFIFVVIISLIILAVSWTAFGEYLKPVFKYGYEILKIISKIGVRGLRPILMMFGIQIF